MVSSRSNSLDSSLIDSTNPLANGFQAEVVGPLSFWENVISILRWVLLTGAGLSIILFLPLLIVSLIFFLQSKSEQDPNKKQAKKKTGIIFLIIALGTFPACILFYIVLSVMIKFL